MYEDLKLYIDGEFTAGDSGVGEDVLNPSNDEILANVPHAKQAELDKAVAAAEKGYIVGSGTEGFPLLNVLASAGCVLGFPEGGDPNTVRVDLTGADCRAGAAGQAESYPYRRPAPAPRRESRVVALVSHRGRLLMFRRPPDDPLLAGLWELPWVVGEPGADAEGELGRRYGGRWRLGNRLAVARHAITTRRIEAGLWQASRSDGGAVAEGLEAGWHEPSSLDGLPTGSLDTKLLRAVEKYLAGD